MWKELQKSPAFFLLLVKGQRYQILITDYIRIWEEVFYNENEFITRLKESNIGLEMDKSELLDEGFQMLQKPSQLKNIKITVDCQTLSVSMTLSRFPLKLHLSLQEGSRELFFLKITQPAMRTIHDLRCSQQELRKMLITKDDEIEEYKSFGGKIRYTAIAPYNDDAHIQKHCLYKEHFGDTEVPPSILDRVIQENLIVKEEKVETKISLKLEPVSQEINTQSIATNTSSPVKKENIKTEFQSTRKRKLNL